MCIVYSPAFLIVCYQGVSVINGGFSTLLAVVLLAFSQSAGFRVLFKMFFGIVVFGKVALLLASQELK